MSDKDKAAPLICVETQKPGRDASPDVHGLDAVRQLIHAALVLQGSQRDDGGVGRGGGVLLQGLAIRCCHHKNVRDI